MTSSIVAANKERLKLPVDFLPEEEASEINRNIRGAFSKGFVRYLPGFVIVPAHLMTELAGNQQSLIDTAKKIFAPLESEGLFMGHFNASSYRDWRKRRYIIWTCIPRTEQVVRECMYSFYDEINVKPHDKDIRPYLTIACALGGEAIADATQSARNIEHIYPRIFGTEIKPKIDNITCTNA